MNILSQKQSDFPAFKCTLFRRRDGMWKRYAKQVQVILQGLSVSALTVRDVQDSTLIADYPKDAVRSADIIRKERVVRINSASHASATLALQFANDSVINAFIQELNWCVVKEITTTMAEPSFKMPDLQDSSVQDLILNLLFDASFTRISSLISAWSWIISKRC